MSLTPFPLRLTYEYFNQENSTPVKIDLENISNRAICVIKEDLVLTAKDAIIHNSERLAEIIMSITKSKRVGRLNIVKVNNGKIQVVGVGKATIKITAFSNNRQNPRRRWLLLRKNW